MTIPYITASKNILINYLGLALSEDMNYMYPENYIIFMREINTNMLKDSVLLRCNFSLN